MASVTVTIIIPTSTFTRTKCTTITNIFYFPTTITQVAIFFSDNCFIIFTIRFNFSLSITIEAVSSSHYITLCVGDDEKSTRTPTERYINLILGFFIDFVEICFIIVPIIAPVAEIMGINMTWFAILIAMNLQTSFLTPPFGFSLFYLKGVAPKGVTTRDIYRGVMPFIGIQILVLASLLVFPEFYGM